MVNPGPSLSAPGSKMANRNLLCIGGSEGALAATTELLKALGEAPVAVCVVHHIGHHASELDHILQRATPMPVRFVETDRELATGNVYLAPPDNHLLVDSTEVRLFHGAAENNARPAIDPLFRSAALSHSTSVMAALMSGNLDDGVAGIQAVERTGGLAFVQEPSGARAPSMPQSAIDALGSRVRAVAPPREIGHIVADLARQPAPEPKGVPADVAAEHLAFLKASGPDLIREFAITTPLTCPQCEGPLHQLKNKDITRFRCNVGHAFTLQALDYAQRDGIERAMWAALRALQQRVKALESLRRDNLAKSREHAASRLEKELEEAQRHANLLLSMLLSEEQAATA